MLKGQQFLNTVKQDQLVTSRVNHAVKPHHPDMLIGTIDKNFVETIESKKTANLQYFDRMKILQTDQLDMGLQQYQRLKMTAQIQKENDRKDYRERVNGVLGQIEKNIMNRSRLFQSQLFKQNEKQKRFIDENAIKERKISEYVNINYDKDVFHHESDRYREYQNLENSQTLRARQFQRLELQKKRDQQQNVKQIEAHQRVEYERNLEYQRFVEQQQKMRHQQKYQLDLKKLVEQKKQANRIKPEPTVDHRRHNPITNPIEYHIDNPYILKRLEKYK